MSLRDPWPHVPAAPEVKPFRPGVLSFGDYLHYTNGKKKLRGSLALMVGGALKPASAGADTSTNVTAVEMTIVLSLPERVCNKVRATGPPSSESGRRQDCFPRPCSPAVRP